MRALLVGLLAGGALLWAVPGAADESPEERRVTLVAINDFHGSLREVPQRDQPGRAMGGLPWLAGALDTLRAERPDLVLVDAGDEFLGSWAVNQTRGMAAVQAFELLGVEAAAVGNHEFDYGGGPDGAHPLRGALMAAAQAANYPFLTANIREVATDGSSHPWQPEGIHPWTLIERNGVVIGVIGVTTTDTPQTTMAEHVADLRFDDPVEVVRRLAPEVRAAGAEVLVVAGHLTGACSGPDGSPGPAPCLPDGELGRLLTELPRGTIDVIAAGHEHRLMAFRRDDTFVLEAGSHGRALNRVDLVIGPGGLDLDASTLYPPWLLDHQAVEPGCDGGAYPLEARLVGGRMVTPSAEALALVEAAETEAGSLCDRIGCTEVALEAHSETESTLGDLVADATLAAFEGADVAIQNSGGLRADIPAGQIRREQVHAVMPFDNQLLLVELDGAQLLTLFRIGSSGAHGILQVAGASYRFDPTVETGTDLDGDGEVASFERARLCQLRVAGQPVDPARRYRVALTDFLYGGGDHLGAVLDGAPVVARGPLLRDAIGQYIEGIGACIVPSAAARPSRIEVGPCE